MSMTREEAAKWLEETIQDTDTYFSSCSEALQKELDEQKEVFLLALSALRPVSREQVEKVWKGEWELVRRMAASIECKCPKCQRTVIFTGKPANFCEKCGSANTDEAVEMVMERMETLYENT